MMGYRAILQQILDTANKIRNLGSISHILRYMSELQNPKFKRKE